MESPDRGRMPKTQTSLADVACTVRTVILAPGIVTDFQTLPLKRRM